jgi:hypothetical protein
MQQLTDTESDSAARWESVIADLAARQQGAREHVERRREEKRELTLEAALGSVDAERRLAKVNANRAS